MNINKDTRLIGLLGYPLGHSFSPAMQNEAFRAAGLNKLYIPIEVAPEELRDVVRTLPKINFEGCNVTIPHKVKIMDYLDEIDEAAAKIGAVNVITIKDGKLKGYNSDGRGFYRSFVAETGTTVEGKSVFVIGAGGASRAICMTMALQGAEKIYICNRTIEKAVSLSEDIAQKVKPCSVPIQFNSKEMEEALANADVVINTTSVGMHPNTDATPLAKEHLDKRFIVCDIVYNPIKTRLLKEAESLGCKTVTGLAMLVNQGAESFKLWTGMEPPLEKMFSVVKSLVK